MGRKLFGVFFDAPLTLSFSFICVVVFVIDKFAIQGLVLAIFSAPGNQTSAMAFDWTQPIEYIRLFAHVLGHSNWNHLATSLFFILFFGPLLEERYGAPILLLMFVVVAFVTGILNAVFLDISLLGASGIAFMMILLACFGSIDAKTGVPLTFIFIFAIYLVSEISTSFVSGSIANFTHVAGGLCGSIFGFIGLSKKRKRRTRRKTSTAKSSTPVEKTKPKASADPDKTIVK